MTPADDRPDTDRLPEIELLRGIAIFAIVGTHCIWGYVLAAPMDAWQGPAAAMLEMITWSGVPLFVALSVIGLYQRYGSSNAAVELGAMLRRRAVALLPAYAFWSFASTALIAPERLRSPGAVLSMLIDGSADAQFYFIPLLFQVYFVWPLLQTVVRWCGRDAARGIAVVAAAFVLTYGAWRAGGAGWLRPGFFTLLPSWLGVVVLAAVAAPHFAELRSRGRASLPVLAAVSIAVGLALVSAAQNFLDIAGPRFTPLDRMYGVMAFQLRAMPLSLSVSAAAVVVAVGRANARADSWLVLAGRHSYGIFLIHFIVLRFVVEPRLGSAAGVSFVAAAGLGWIAHMAATWAACFVFSFAVVAIGSRFRPLAPLLSNRWAAA